MLSFFSHRHGISALQLSSLLHFDPKKWWLGFHLPPLSYVMFLPTIFSLMLCNTNISTWNIEKLHWLIRLSNCNSCVLRQGLDLYLISCHITLKTTGHFWDCSLAFYASLLFKNEMSYWHKIILLTGSHHKKIKITIMAKKCSTLFLHWIQ